MYWKMVVEQNELRANACILGLSLLALQRNCMPPRRREPTGSNLFNNQALRLDFSVSSRNQLVACGRAPSNRQQISRGQPTCHSVPIRGMRCATCRSANAQHGACSFNAGRVQFVEAGGVQFRSRGRAVSRPGACFRGRMRAVSKPWACSFDAGRVRFASRWRAIVKARGTRFEAGGVQFPLAVPTRILATLALIPAYDVPHSGRVGRGRDKPCQPEF